MHAPEITDETTRDGRIMAEPPFTEPPFDRKESLPVSRTRVWIGVLLLIVGFAVGGSSSLFPAAKLWLGIIGLLLIVFSFFVLGLRHLRYRGRHPRKLYGHERI